MSCPVVASNREEDGVVEMTPWYNKKEFEEVFHALYSKNAFQMKWAVDRVNVWEGRCHPTLDIGIDATVFLVRALLQDTIHEYGTNLCDSHELRMLYAMGLIRFINVVTRACQGKTTKMPLRTAAAMMGIPSWIVEIRNSGAHGRLPCLEQLREGAEFALDYLRVNFWEKECGAFLDFTRLPCNSDKKVSEVLLIYKSCQYEILLNNGTESSEQKLTIRQCLRDMSTFIKKNPVFFLKTLASPGLFLPGLEDLKKLLNHTNETSFIETQSVDLPKALVDLWMPVIDLIAKKDIMQEFVQMLLKAPEKKNDLQERIAACWLRSFIEGSKNSPVLQRIPKRYQPYLNFFKLLYYCLKNSNIYSAPLLQVITDQIYPRLTERESGNIKAVAALKLRIVPKNIAGVNKTKTVIPPPAKNGVYTVRQLKEVVKRSRNDLGESNWHRSTGEWSKIPFGYVFGDENDFTNLTAVTPLGNMPSEDISENIDVTVKEEKPEITEPMEIQIEEEEEEEEYSVPLEFNPEKMYCYRSRSPRAAIIN